MRDGEASKGFDGGRYWEERHAGAIGDLRSVGNIGVTHAENERQILEKTGILIWTIGALGFRRTATLLDAGCGQGFVTRHLAAVGFDCTGVDVSPTAIAAAREAGGGRYEASALDEMRLGTEFEVVLCVDVLYHVVDEGRWRGALEALRAHVSDAGIILIVEYFPGEPSRTSHCRWRSRAEYEAAFAAVGVRTLMTQTFRESVTGHEKTIIAAARR